MAKKSDIIYTIKEVLEQRFDEMGNHLTEIKTQVIKTNGRVNVLENHKAYLWGAFSVLTLLGGTIIFFAIESIESKIQSGIAQALKDNVSEIIYEK
jgi:hypothetical protein